MLHNKYIEFIEVLEKWECLFSIPIHNSKRKVCSFAYVKSSIEKIIILLSLIICFTYACTDEFHQSFIPGRTSQFIDVIIDTTGGLLSVFIYYILLRRRDKNE